MKRKKKKIQVREREREEMKSFWKGKREGRKRYNKKCENETNETRRQLDKEERGKVLIQLIS